MARARIDAFGPAVQTFGLDGTVTLYTKYHALSADAWDAEDLGPGPHQGTYASEEKDGHGRVTRTTERMRAGAGVEAHDTAMTYQPTGEVTSITRSRGGDSVTRTIAYDTLGRMVENMEDSTKGDGRGIRYVYNEAGDLIGTSDGRGCGVNFAYDAGGRLVSENYAPCETHQPVYDTTAEVEYEYDGPDDEAADAFTDEQVAQNCRTTNFTAGRLVATIDRGGKTLTCYDGRGRTIEVAKKLRAPDGSWSTRWFRRRATFDAADRPRVETTGATVNMPSGVTTSSVTTSYSRRGDVKSVDSTYGALVSSVKRDADGLVTEIVYGDGAATTTAFTYDDLRRLRNLTTYRSQQSTWPTSGTWTTQMLLQDEEYSYDRVGNPVEVHDWRAPGEWPDGSKPVTSKMRYDDLYRLTRIDYQYPEGSDDWVDPFAAEVSDNTRPQPSPRADFTGASRPLQQSFDYDWLGNTAATDDDAHAFYDRSLGEITNTGYQLTGADNGTQSARRGSLAASYDNSGNLEALDVHREGPCVPSGKCTDQHFEYEWDEVGRLVRARRWDMANPDTIPPDAELQYTYDAADQRVRKTVVAGTEQRHTLYVFGSLELRLAQYESGNYELSEATEVPYLQAHGVRLARVVHTEAPDFTTPSVRVYLELGDQLGSTSVVLDRATGELVERTTAYAYGATESDHRPERWDEFREDYRFTGKEEDIEVGLQYFGKRFYAPLLQRWVSPDPLAVHAPGQADLNLYAYVHGRVLVAVDPVGLDDGKVTKDTTTWNPQAGQTERSVEFSDDSITAKPPADAKPAPSGVNVLRLNPGSPPSRQPQGVNALRLQLPQPPSAGGGAGGGDAPPQTQSEQPGSSLGDNLIVYGTAGPATRYAYNRATSRLLSQQPTSPEVARRMVYARGGERLAVRGVTTALSLYFGWKAAEPYFQQDRYVEGSLQLAPAALNVGMSGYMFYRDARKYGSVWGVIGSKSQVEARVTRMMAGEAVAGKTSEAFTRLLGGVGTAAVHAGFLLDLSQLPSDNPDAAGAAQDAVDDAVKAGGYRCTGSVIIMCGPK